MPVIEGCNPVFEFPVSVKNFILRNSYVTSCRHITRIIINWNHHIQSIITSIHLHKHQHMIVSVGLSINARINGDSIPIVRIGIFPITVVAAAAGTVYLKKSLLFISVGFV
jgi:hypothetical protein